MQVVSRKTFRDALARAEREVAVRPSDIEVAGLRYRVLAHLADGDRSRVLLATRARPLTERVVIKVLRGGSPGDLDQQWEALEALHASTSQGAPHFTLRLPPLVARGDAAIVFRPLPGHDTTLAELPAAFPAGLDPRHAVWIWRRLLELLGWVHRSGWTHGAIAPSHVVIDPREHGAILVGWSRAAHLSAAGATADLAMAAQTVLATLGALGIGTRAALATEQLLTACARGDLPSSDGWQMKELVAEAARHDFGPPQFVPLDLPPRPDPGRDPPS
jgi:hypothetical protein